MSPWDPAMELDVDETPARARIVVKLWRDEPKSIDAPPSFLWIMELE